VGFVVDKVALGQVFSEYFGFPCQSSFHQLLHNHPHLSSRAGTIGQKWPQYKGISSTPLAIRKKKEVIYKVIGFPHASKVRHPYSLNYCVKVYIIHGLTGEGRKHHVLHFKALSEAIPC
jgi:hypothetical protein